MTIQTSDGGTFVPRDGACSVCGLPDNCGDCKHIDLTEEEWAALGEKAADWPSPPGLSWDECGDCSRPFLMPDPIPDGAYWLTPEYGSNVYCSEDCCNNASEAAYERMLEQYYGGATWP